MVENRIKIVKYHPEYKSLWDNFIANSKNGVFLFYRDYMEYHADRFTDYSLLFFEDEQLVAVMPANLTEKKLISHGGLTFGGIISNHNMKMPLMLAIFEALRGYLINLDLQELIYKVVPHIYHKFPAEEDLYALFRHQATLFRRDVSSTIFMPVMLKFSKGRKWSIKKAKENGLEVRQSNDFDTFMAIDEQHLLEKHHKRPVHTAAELRLLANRFSEHIKLFASYDKNIMLGGVVMYESGPITHAQYIAATTEGKEIGALDLILDFLINDYYRDKRYFDFGISTDHQGQYLDMGLVANKESFGGRTTIYDFYKIDLAA